MNDDRGLVRGVSWRDLCPWLIIFRAYRQAVRAPVLALATVAVLLTPLGWRLGERLFLGEDRFAAESLDVFRDDVGNVHRWPWGELYAPAADEFQRPELARGAYGRAMGQMASTFHGLTDPFRRMFRYEATLSEFAYFLFAGLWTLAIWALAGGAITRLAIVPLAADRNVGFAAALRHALGRFPTYFLSPLFPILGVVILAAVLAMLGLVLRIDGLGVLIAGVLWFVVLLCGVGMAFILVGLLFSWPLMWCVTSAERDADVFEATSRAYSYTRQAPLKYLFYVLVALLFGGLCWLLVAIFAEAVLMLGDWGVSWGAGRDTMLRLHESLAAYRYDGAAHPSASVRVGIALISAWTLLVRAVVAGFAFSFFWCAFSAIYLLLRFDVDRREMDEIWTATPRETTGGTERATA